jgi:FkbM family methyltransferase
MEILRALTSASVGGGRLGVDVGANVGSVSEMLFDASPAVSHVLIEPVEHLADRLRDRFPGAEVHQVVCGEIRAEVEFNVAIDLPTRSSLDPALAASGGRTERRELQQVPLDEIIGDRRPGLVKIDVEGAELRVLRGLRSTLTSARPLLVFEHFTIGDDGRTTTEIHRLLNGASYKVFDIDGAGPFDADQFVRRVARGKVWTFVATPRVDESVQPQSGAHSAA